MQGNESELLFAVCFFGIPLFIAFVGVMSGDKKAMLGALKLVCMIQIGMDVLAFLVSVSSSNDGGFTEKQAGTIIFLFIVSAVVLILLKDKKTEN